MPTSISTHVSSLVGVVVAAIAAFHPGFTLTPAQTTIVVAIGTGGALLLQLAHVRLSATALKYLHEYEMLERQLTGSLSVATPTPPASPAPTPVQVPHAEGSNNAPFAPSS